MVVVDLGFCPRCGGTLAPCEVEGRQRSRCRVCGFTVFRNPIPVVVVAVVDGNSALFVRRARAPEKGCWSLPGGYLEVGETPQSGAVRELHEETGLAVSGDDLTFVGTIHEPVADVGVVDIVFAVPIEKTDGTPVAGDEAVELSFWSREDIAADPPTLRAGDVEPILWAIDMLGDDGLSGTAGDASGMEFGFDPAKLASATVTRATRGDPLAPVARFERRLSQATSARILSYAIAAGPLGLVRERVLAGELWITAILDAESYRHTSVDPTLAEMIQEIIDTGRAEVLIHEDVPYLLGLVDGSALVGLTTGHGAPYALIESDEPTVVDWVASTIDEFGSEGESIDITSTVP